MPLVRITLLKGRSDAELRAIADGVHAALVETFSVPEKDRFQVIEQREPGELIYSPDYLGIERSDGVVFINIVASATRDTPTKQALYRAIAAQLSARAAVRPEDVVVVLSPNDRPDWSFGMGDAQYVEPAKSG